MGPSRLASRGLAFGIALGLWLGVADGARALVELGVSAGPLSHRLGTLALAMGVDAALFGALGGGLFALLALALRGRSPSLRAPWGRTLFLSSCGLAIAAAGVVASGRAPEHTPVVPGNSASSSERPNILLISVDTLRADHTSVYGYTRETTPVLEALARKGVVFQEAYAHASWTLPSHASLLTGLDPITLGVLTPRDRIPEKADMLAERLSEAGYFTAAWVGMPSYGYIGARYGFDAGFRLFHHAPHARPFRASWIARRLDQCWLRGPGRGVGNAKAQTDSVLRFLRSHRREPFFAFVHYYDVHSKFDALPYEAPAAYRDRFCEDDPGPFEGCREGVCASDRLMAINRGESQRFDARELARVQCLYDGGIAYVDSEIGRLLEALDALGIAEETVVVVTSDHGEGFLEHDQTLHATLHEEVARVPLIIRLPAGAPGDEAAAGRKVSGPVGLVNVAPTLLELAGVAPRARPSIPASAGQGKSLTSILRSWRDEPQDEVLAVDGDGQIRSLRKGRYKLIRPLRGGRDELFDLRGDQQERDNRAAFDEPALERLGLALETRVRTSERLRQQLFGGGAGDKDVKVSPEESAALKALGYVETPE